MKILIEKRPFTTLLHNAMSYIVNRKNVIPAIQGVLLTIISETQIKISSTDVDVYLTETMNAKVEKELVGNIYILDSKFLVGLLPKLDGETIVLTFMKSTMKITTEGNTYSAPFTKGEDFLLLPEIDTDSTKIIFETPVLKNYINKCLPFVAKDDSTPVFSGIHYTMKDKKVSIEATTRAVALKAVDKCSSEAEVDIILPAKFADTYSKVYDGDKTELIVSKKHVRLEGENFILQAKLIEGKFPDTTKLFAQKRDNSIDLLKANIMPALKRLLLVGQSTSTSKWETKASELVIESEDKDFAMKGKEIFLIPHDGADLLIGLNPELVIKSLEAFKLETVHMGYGDQKEAAILTDEGGAVSIVIAPLAL